MQSSERIDGYGSNPIVLQAPVKRIIKTNNETRVSVLQDVKSSLDGWWCLQHSRNLMVLKVAL